MIHNNKQTKKWSETDVMSSIERNMNDGTFDKNLYDIDSNQLHVSKLKEKEDRVYELLNSMNISVFKLKEYSKMDICLNP